MTLSETIFAQHAIRNVAPEDLAAGDLVRVSVDWVISAELAWAVSTFMKSYARRATYLGKKHDTEYDLGLVFWHHQGRRQGNISQ